MSKTEEHICKILDYVEKNIVYVLGIGIGVYIWWLITAVVRVFLGDGTFPALFSKTWTVVKWAIPVWIIVSLLLAVLYYLVETFFFQTVIDESGIRQKHAIWYSFWGGIYVCLLPMTILGFAVIKFHTLQRTTMIAGMLVMLSCAGDFWYLLWTKRKIRKWIEHNYDTEKNFCTITSANSFFPLGGKNTEEFLKPQNGFKKSIKGCKCLFENAESYVCDHFIYKELFPESKVSKCVILVDDEFTDIGNEVASALIDEYSKKKIPVMKLIWDKEYQHVGKEWPVDTIYLTGDETEKKDDFAKKVASKITSSVREVHFFDQDVFGYQHAIDIQTYLKYRYVNQQLQKLQEITEPADCFYHLLKMTEYVFHYRALAELVINEKKQKNLLENSFKSAMGTWEKFQNNDRSVYRDAESVKAYRLIESLLSGKPCGKMKVSYQEVCEVLTKLRNRYIGHGTMAFSVSEELLNAVKKLVAEILRVFYEKSDAVLYETMRIKNGVPVVMIREHEGINSICLLAGYVNDEVEITEYLDYENAAFVSNREVRYQLNYEGGV